VRAVLDTIVLISGLLWRGPPHVLIERARAGDWTIVSSSVILAEFSSVIRRRKFMRILALSRTDLDRTLRELRLLAEIVEPLSPVPAVSRDPADDVVLAIAVMARSDLIVSGDDDLLSLRVHEGIPIVDPAAALEWLR